MLGLGLLISGLMLNPQANTQAMQVSLPMSCKGHRAPQINVKPSQSRVKYDFTRSKAELNTVDSDTISPYGPQHKTNVNGLMSGNIRLQSSIFFVTETYNQFNYGCVYLKRIDVEINVDPTVYIASDFDEGGCMHNAILAHEYKHVNEDQYIVNKYINEIGKALSAKVEILGGEYGPMKISDMVNKQNEIQQSFHDEVRYMNQVLNTERKQRQQDIDSLEEYQSIGIRCKNRR